MDGLKVVSLFTSSPPNETMCTESLHYDYESFLKLLNPFL